MVRDLVVGKEGRVDDGPAGHHVSDHGGDLKVALHDRCPRSHGGVHPASRDSRLDIPPALLCLGPPLACHLTEGEHERSRHGVWIREVRRVVAADGPPAAQDRAHREHRVRGVAGHDVRAARTARVKQSAPVGMAALELLGVARVAGDDRDATVLLPPAEGRNVVVVPVQKAGLTRAGLRRPVGLPAHETMSPVAEPARKRWCVPVAHGAPQDVVGQAVYLQEDQPGDIALRAVAPTARLPADHIAVPRLVLVDREQRGKQRREQRHPKNDADTRPDVLDARTRNEVDGEHHKHAVQNEAGQPQGQDV